MYKKQKKKDPLASTHKNMFNLRFLARTETHNLRMKESRYKLKISIFTVSVSRMGNSLSQILVSAGSM